MNERPTYGLVGRGRVATHLAHYLDLENRPFVCWHRGSSARVEDVLGACDVILLAINDDAIESFARHRFGCDDRALVHFSGSRVVDGVHSCHPLMTFGPELYDLGTYRSMAFITERGGASFAELFPGLANPSWEIDPEQKPLYHALCVLGGNFSTMLWSKVISEFSERLGLPAEALGPYMNQVCRNVLRSGGAALTGPLQRGDTGTIRCDMEALRGDAFAEVYRAFVRISDREEVAV